MRICTTGQRERRQEAKKRYEARRRSRRVRFL